MALPAKSAVQVANVPLPLSVQLVLAGDPPAPVAVRLTVPVGANAPGEVSVTVTVQVPGTLMTTGPAQLTPVVVVCSATLIDPLPVLAEWLLSPG